MYTYTYIYIYIHTYAQSIHCMLPYGVPPRTVSKKGPWLRENHLSNTTCLTQVFFKSGEQYSKLW